MRCPQCGASLAAGETLQASAERARGALCIQTASRRPSRIQGFPHSFRGLAAQGLDS